MATSTITDIDTGKPFVDGTFSDETLNLASGATVKAGTILARNTSTLKLQLYVKGGSSNGNGIPVCVLGYELAGVTGDNPVRPFVGKVKTERLVIHADGDNSNVDNTVLDLLRAHGIVPESYAQLGSEDNEPGDS